LRVAAASRREVGERFFFRCCAHNNPRTAEARGWRLETAGGKKVAPARVSGFQSSKYRSAARPGSLGCQVCGSEHDTLEAAKANIPDATGNRMDRIGADGIGSMDRMRAG